jgi:HlyD family secretion protein
MRFRFIWLGVIFIAAGLGVTRLWAGRPDLTYITAPIEQGDIVTTLTATGQLSAVVTVTVGSQQSGQVAELMVDFNEVVTKGQAIARLDPSIFAAKVRQAEAGLEEARAAVAMQQAALEKAKVDLDSAKNRRDVVAAQAESAGVLAENSSRDFKRKKLLVARSTIAPAAAENASAAYRSAAALFKAAQAEGTVAETAVPAAAAGLDMAQATLQHAVASLNQQQAALEQAKIDLERTVIRSPIDGVVIDRKVELGQTVAATLEAPTLFTIAHDLRDMVVYAKINEADIGRVRPGQRASFSVDAHPERDFEATVSEIRKSPQVIENVVAYNVVLTAPNNELTLLPGMTAMVHLVVDRTANVLKIPNAALRFRPQTADRPSAEAGTAIVWIKGFTGAPEAVRVKLGSGGSSSTELVGGSLKAGDRVIIGTTPTAGSSPWLGINWGT